MKKVICLFVFAAVIGLSNVFAAEVMSIPVEGAQISEKSELDKVREAFVEASVATYAVEEDVWNRFIESSDHGMANDVLLLQLYTSVRLPDAEVERLIKRFDFEEGCFKDIDYTSDLRGSWPATRHVTRLQSLAKVYKAGNDKWKGSERLHQLLHAGMAYWFRTMPVCPNWWHNDIGVPKKMTTVLLMLRDELSEDEIAGGLKVLERSKFGMTGQNKAWLAGNNLMKGLLIDDEELVLRARDYIAEEICVTDAEGIQDDWSFHQHGPQIQFGNYGLAYADGLAFWCRVLAGTKYMFTEEQTELFSNFMKEGLCRCVFKGMMDPSFCGRQVFINAGRGKVCSLAVAAQNMSVAMGRMAEAVNGDSQEAETLVERYLSEASFYDSVSRENLYLTDSSSGLNGAKYFNRSDCGIYRTKDWYSSVRMHSERTIGFEFTNRENTLANFSADGAVLLMQDGGEYENIFACWDWRKVPGVTAYDDGKPLRSDNSVLAKRNRTGHVGGLVAETSVGDVMTASMRLNRDGLHALKSTFFFEDCIVALGSDINVTNPEFKEVTTAIDQNRLNGKVTYDKSAVDVGEGIHTGVRWAHHNNRGYVSLDGNGMTVSETVQKGKWDYIEPSYKDRWDEMPIFKCWFEHPLDGLKDGGNGSYAYAILPCASASDTKAFEKKVGGKKSPVYVLENSAECQAVSHDGVICAVVHKAGKYELDGWVLEADRPCIIIRDGEDISTEYLEEDIKDIAEMVFDRAAVQFKLLDKNTDELEAQAAASGDDKHEKLYPRVKDKDGKLGSLNYLWWCSGFYPGCLWIMYERTGLDEWKELALKYTLPLEPLKYRTNHHDVGFQLMSSFGRGLRLTGNKDFENVLITGAGSLASRFNPTIGCTRSWDNKKWTFAVIIDNMMNLELLLTVADLTGNDELRKIAVTHSETTMKNHFRKDYSTWHLVDYDPEDGHVIGKQTWQGYSDDSAWSRGQAWGLYGYTMVYRFTKDKKFRNQAVKIADYLIPRLPEDGVPYWDYDAPNIPNEEKDASAAAVMASALIELSGYVDVERAFRYQSVARKIMRTLASDEYLAKEGEIYGFLLKHSVGTKPGKSEVDVPLPYADYYFLEALMRYLEM